MILFERAKNLSPKERFLQSVEGMGDLLESAVRYRKTALVSDGLERLRKLFDVLQDLRTTDIDKFERLILSNQLLEIAEKDQERARVELGFNPERHARGLHALISQFLRIQRVAIEEKNDEISRRSVYQLNYVLARAASQKGNGFVVEQLIVALSEAAQAALAKDDRSVYAAAIHWYTDIVFNRLQSEGDVFEMEYLALFSDKFFRLAQIVIREGHERVFDAFASSLVDGVSVDSDWQRFFWNTAHFIKRPEFYREFDPSPFERKMRTIIGNGLTKENLPKAIEVIADMETAIRPFLSDETEKQGFLAAVEEFKSSIADSLKYQELLLLVNAIGAYCVFKSAEGPLKALWEYKQPRDADAHYAGHEIIPDNLNQIFSLFYGKEIAYRRHDFREDHHGSEAYFDKYLVLLLARQVDASREMKLLSSDDPILLHRIADRISRLKEIAKKLFVEGRWQTLYLKPNEELLRGLLGHLDSIGEAATGHLDAYVVKSPISEERVAEFRSNFMKEFEKENWVRKLLIAQGVFERDSTFNPEHTKRLWREKLEVGGKEPFLASWYSQYMDWGKQYGSLFASTEAVEFVKVLLAGLPMHSLSVRPNKGRALEILNSAVGRLLEGGYEPSVILTSYDIEAIEELTKTSMYLPHWHEDCPKLDVPGYHGSLIHGKRFIPLIWGNPLLRGRALVLDCKRVGKWSQYSPLREVAEETSRQDDFVIRVESLGHSEALLEKLIRDNPPWLQKYEDKRDYLLSRALLTIRESFEFSVLDSNAGVQVVFKGSAEEK